MGIKNYGCAYLPCPLSVYLICSFAASIPYCLLWAMIGSSSRNLLEKTETKFKVTQNIFLVVALLLTLVVVFVIRYYVNKEMKAINRNYVRDGTCTQANRSNLNLPENETEDYLRAASDSGSERSQTPRR